MADTVARLNILCGATDNASGILSGISGKLMALGAAAAAIGTIVVIGKKSLDAFVEFDTAISKSMMMFEDFGSGVRGEVEDVSRSLSKEFGYSAAEVADGFYAMGSAGLDAAQSLAMIEPVTRFALASGGELGIEEASETAMTAMKAFGQTVEEVPHTLDVLAYAGKETNTNLNDLSQAFAYVAPAAGTFGMSVEEVSAALGMMSDVGIKGSSAGTALRRIITNLVAPTGQAAQAIEALNLQVYETGSSGNDLIASIASCQNEMDQYQMSINETTTALLGLEDAQRGFNIEYQTLQLERMRIEDRLKDEGRDATEAEKKRLGEIESAQRDLRISMQENTVESLKLEDQQADTQTAMADLTSEIENTQSALESGGGEMRDFGDILEGIITGTEDMTEAQKNEALTMLAGVRGISGLVSLLGDGGQAYNDFVTDAENADGIVKDMSDFMAGSAGVKIAAFKQHINDLAISLGEKLYPWVEKVMNFFTEHEGTFKKIGNVIMTFVSAIGSLLTGDFEGYASKLIDGYKSIWKAIKKIDWGDVWDKLKKSAGKAWDVIKRNAGVAWDRLKTWFKNYDWAGLWDKIKEAASNAWDKIKEAAGKAWDNLKTWFKNYDWAGLWDKIKTLASNAWDEIKRLAGNAWDNLKTWFKNYDWAGAWDTLKSGASKVWDGLKTGAKDAWNALKTEISNIDWGAVWDTIVDSAKLVGSRVGKAIVSGIGWLGEKVGDAADYLGDIDWVQAGRDAANKLQDWGSKLGDNFSDTVDDGGVEGAANLGKNFITSLGSLFWNIALAMKEIILGMAGLIGGFLYEMMCGAWDKLSDWWEEDGKPWLLDLPNKIKEQFVNAGTWLFDKGRDIINGLKNGLVSAWQGVISWVISKINWLIEQYNKIPLVPDIDPIGGNPNTSPEYTYNMSTDPFFNQYNTPYASPSNSSMPTAAAEQYGSFASRFGTRFNDFILSGGRAYSFNPRDTIIGTKTPERVGGGKSYSVVQNLYFQNVADETYIHKIGSMVEKSLRRVVA